MKIKVSDLQYAWVLDLPWVECTGRRPIGKKLRELNSYSIQER